MIDVASIAGLATIQDGGRPGHMHDGVPPGGALVPELLARANDAVGNAHDAPAIELFGAMRVVAREDTVVAFEDGVAREWKRDVALDVRAEKYRVRYLAVRGSFDVPLVLGGRGTLLGAAFGGFEGRALRKGDGLSLGVSKRGSRTLQSIDVDIDSPIRVILGPDGDAFAPSALHVFTNSEFTISPSSDRTGTRLVGPSLARARRDDGVSAPMVTGAIEAPASGSPIVMGPDHPTTGGYPIIATIVCADLGRFAARRIGAPVRFVILEGESPWPT